MRKYVKHKVNEPNTLSCIQMKPWHYNNDGAIYQ